MKKKVLISLILLTAIIFFGTAYYKHITFLCNFFNTTAIGTVSDIRYNTQKLVEIKLNSNENWIYLGANITYDVKIEKGDSIYKRSRDYKSILIKNNQRYDISSERKVIKLLKYCKCK
jgi:hypothetical protein